PLEAGGTEALHRNADSPRRSTPRPCPSRCRTTQAPAGHPSGRTEMRDPMPSLRYLVCALLAVMIELVPAQPHAQSWPQRTVRIILPLPTGGGTDLAARLFAEGL